jgi:hypothetical protein
MLSVEYGMDFNILQISVRGNFMTVIILIVLTFVCGIIITASNNINKRATFLAILGVTLGLLLGMINTPATLLYEEGQKAVKECQQHIVEGEECIMVVTAVII